MAIVLVIDDDMDMLELTRKYLSGEGYEVLVVSNPFDADEILDKYRISLALVDINMPMKNGYDLVAQMKRSIRNRFVPVVFMSGRSEKKDIERAFKLDVEGYIIKPFDKKTLVEKVKSVLSNTKNTATGIESVKLDSRNITGDLKLAYQIKILSISEIGITVSSSLDIGEVGKVLENSVEIAAPIWAHVGIEPALLKITNKVRSEDHKQFIISMLFKNMSPEDVLNLRQWIRKNAG